MWLLPHLAAAAFEHPITRDDERFWSGLLDEGVRRLVLDDRLRVRRRRRGPTAVWGEGFPAHGVGLRSGSGSEIGIATHDGDLVGTVDEGRAHLQVHPGAVYLHQGRRYRVDDLDLTAKQALVTDDGTGELTQPRTDTDIRILDVEERQAVGHACLALASLEVTRQVTGFRRTDGRTGEVLGHEELDLPATLW